MQDPSTEMTVVPCHGCRKPLTVPSSHVKAAIRERQPFIRFCTRACNLTFVAREGAKQQEETLRNAD